MNYSREILNIEGYERVICASNPSVGLCAIIAIHNTNLGPACGGVRLRAYASKDEALNDALRLSKGMSYKSALAGIAFGGGKSVILCDPSKKNPELFSAFGEIVDSLGGQYITAKDMNVSGEDLKIVKQKTNHVLGIEGLAESSGDPSPVTAVGVLRGLYASLEEMGLKKENESSLSGLKVAIQGLGAVGLQIAKDLKKAGCEIWATDANEEVLNRASNELGVQSVSTDDIYAIDCDVFMPCAIGGTLNSTTLPQLKCAVVVGCANNQLETNQHGYDLDKRGILYAPDYAVNSGGIINVYLEHVGYDQKKAMNMAEGIYDTMKEIFRRSKAQGIPPFIVADSLAEERMQKA